MAKVEKAKLTAEMKESIANQVHMYQEEVKQQKNIINVSLFFIQFC